MTETITISHPYPALYVPRSGRNVGGGLFRAETPVTIRRAAAADFEPLPEVPGELPGYDVLRRHEGALWKPLARQSQGRMLIEKPADFLRWLSNPAADHPEGYDDDLGGTPLLAAWDAEINPFRPVAPSPPARPGTPAAPNPVNTGRGDRAGLRDKARELAWSGLEAARAAAVRFMADDIRVTPRRVYVRVRPLAQVYRGYLHVPGGVDLSLRRFGPVRPTVHTVKPYPVRPDLATQALGHWVKPGARLRRTVGNALAQIRPEEYGDADLDLMSNWLPVMTVGMHHRVGASGGLDRGLWENTRQAVEPIRPLALLGLIGANGGEGRDARIEAARTALEGFSAGTWTRSDAFVAKTALEYLNAFVMPRVRGQAAPPPPEDLESLGGLTP
jgi:hypothetical protein